MKPLPVRKEKDDPIVCSICGYPENELNPISVAGMFTFVNFRTKAVGRWVLHICKACLMSMEDVEKNGEIIAKRRKGADGELL